MGLVLTYDYRKCSLLEKNIDFEKSHPVVVMCDALCKLEYTEVINKGFESKLLLFVKTS